MFLTSELYNMLMLLPEASQGRGLSDDATREQNSHKLLAVDDLPDNLFLLDAILSEEEHYQVSCVSSGEDALKSVEDSVPDLILLDVMMPGMTGYEVARQIRQNSDLPYIPILLVTAHEEISAVETMAAGADGFIRKPYDIEELLASVENLLSRKD